MSHIKPHGALLVFASFLVFFFSSCIKAPEKPNWDFELTIPFSERTYRLSDLTDVDVTSLSDTIFRDTLPDNRAGFYSHRDTLIFYISSRFQTQTFYDKISSDPQSAKSTTYKLDTINVDPRECGDVLFSPEFFGLTLNRPVTVPINFDTIKTLDNAGRGFEWIDYVDGNIFAVIENRFPTQIDVFQLRYFDLNGNFVGTSPQVPTINAYSSVSIPINISNPPRRLFNDMRVRIVGRLRATNDTVRTTDSIFVTIRSDSIRSLGARGELAQQIAVSDTLIETGIEDEVYSADIRVGSIDIAIVNRLGVPMDSIWVMFPEITRNNDTLRRAYRNIVSVATETVDLTGYRIALQPPLPGQSQKIYSYGKAYTRPTPTGQYATLMSSDNIELRYVISELKFSRFTGIPDSIEWELDPSHQEITDRPNGNLNINLSSADFILMPRTTTPNIPAIIDLMLTATNPSGQTAVYTLNNQFFNTLNSFRSYPNAQAIINLIPDSIVTTGNIRMGKQFIPNMPVVSVTELDSVYGKGMIESPMLFSFNPQTITSDPELGNGEDRPIQSASISVIGENILPVGGIIHFEITRDTTRTNSYLRIASANIPRPTINQTTRRAQQSTTFSITIPISDSLMRVFESPTFYTRHVLELQGTGTDTLLGHVDDFLRIRTNAKLKINTGDLQ